MYFEVRLFEGVVAHLMWPFLRVEQLLWGQLNFFLGRLQKCSCEKNALGGIFKLARTGVYTVWSTFRRHYTVGVPHVRMGVHCCIFLGGQGGFRRGLSQR